MSAPIVGLVRGIGYRPRLAASAPGPLGPMGQEWRRIGDGERAGDRSHRLGDMAGGLLNPEKEQARPGTTTTTIPRHQRKQGTARWRLLTLVSRVTPASVWPLVLGTPDVSSVGQVRLHSCLVCLVRTQATCMRPQLGPDMRRISHAATPKCGDSRGVLFML